MKEYTPEEFCALLLEYLGARPMEDPELGVVWDDDVSNAKHTMTRCLSRGDGYAIYRNEDLGHPEIGRLKFMSFGSAAAIWEPQMGPVPQQMPDIGGDINWRYTLQGTYRGAMVGLDAVQVESGCTPCACRDCMDVSISSDVTAPELCLLCKEAECTVHNNLPGFMTGYGLGMECQRLDAYGCGEDDNE